MGTRQNRRHVLLVDMYGRGKWHASKPQERGEEEEEEEKIGRGEAAFLLLDHEETREELAWKLVAACQDILGFTRENLNVEFTQHRGDEMFHTRLGGLSDDWQAGKEDAYRPAR